MENKQEKTLEIIHNLLDFDKSEESAIAYGITKSRDSDDLQYKIIASNSDIYDLIGELNEDKIYMTNHYLTLKTTGWAAPLNDKGEVEGSPSQHPKRRRVRLFISVDILDRSVLGSSVQFEDDEEIVYDNGNATGALAEALLGLVS